MKEKFYKIRQKLAFGVAKKLIHKTASTVEKNPEASSLAETMIKRFTNVASFGEKLLHFHLVVFGFALGLTLMTTIIAVGKLLIAMEISSLPENRDLVLNFGYASFFIGVLYGFLRHYTSAHHKRHRAKEIAKATQDYKNKCEELHAEYLKKSVQYSEHLEALKQEIATHEAKLAKLKTKISHNSKGQKLWKTVSAYNPVKGKKSPPEK